jgi:hypothetical protein
MKLRIPIALVVAVGLAGSIGLAQQKPKFERVVTHWTGPFTLGSCGDFNILYDTEADEVDTFWPNQAAYWSCVDGNPTCPARWDYVVSRTGDQYYTDSVDHPTVLWGSPGAQEHSSIRYAADGTKTMDMWEGNLWRVNLPHYGLIFAQLGRLTFDEFGNLASASGQNQFFDQDFAALCNALR